MRNLQRLIAVASAAGLFLGWSGLEGGGLMPWQSLILLAVCGPALIKSCRALGVFD